MIGDDFLADFWARAQAFGEMYRGSIIRAMHSLHEDRPGHSRRFTLQRHEDTSGISGTGTVAWGTEYPNGRVSLTWAGPLTSGAWYDSIDVLTSIHGHKGATEIVWIDR